MAHCTKCGAQIADNAAFCAGCGAAQAAAPGAAPTNAATQAPMAENVASLLCYILGWVTGLVFFLIDKRPNVRFHAAQSIVVFGGLNIISFCLRMLGLGLMAGGLGGFSLGIMISGLVSILTLVLWILLMVKGFQGERFRVPLAADLADTLFGKS